MKSYFAYIRISDPKQGRGVSLQEQHDAIQAFASRRGLSIAAWFEDRETAAKVGRREFSRMLVALKKKKASGVIFHKIDRSARNMKDWSVIQELADLGVDVQFTQESINLASNEGKLTGDFLAAVSSHYIRNLREEVRKGIRGRLKQGLYPFKAYIGYLDQGGGKAKIPDTKRAPFIRAAFELYSTGTFSLHALSDELYERGLRSVTGKKVGVNRLADILRNPFYIGIIRLKCSGETYAGVHEPIIPQGLFARVQDVLNGKRNRAVVVHDFLFRRMVKCVHCGYSLIGESQKGHAYYRCHTRTCPTLSLREELIEHTIRGRMVPLGLLKDEAADLKHRAARLGRDEVKHRQDQIDAIDLQIKNLSERLSRLTDLYLDEAVERMFFEEKKLALLMERKTLEEQRGRLATGEVTFSGNVLRYLELLESLETSYKMANPPEKRRLIKTITSNLRGQDKILAVELKSPFQEIANLNLVPTGGPLRGRPRTKSAKIFDLLVKHCKTHAKELQREEELPLAA